MLLILFFCDFFYCLGEPVEKSLLSQLKSLTSEISEDVEDVESVEHLVIQGALESGML